MTILVKFWIMVEARLRRTPSAICLDTLERVTWS